MFSSYFHVAKRCMSFSATTLLSPQNQAICMKRFQEMLIKQGTRPVVKRAAVLIPIYVQNDEVSLLYTLRSHSLRSYRGQVSFPGGMVNATDATLEYTALRETQEEIGISPDDIMLWGKGNPIIRQDMSILPVIGCLKPNLKLDSLHINRREVSDIFLMKIEDLINPNTHKHTQFKGTFTTPTYIGGPHRIWGMTAVLTFMLLKALLSPKIYTYRINYIPDIVNILATNKKSR